MPALISGVPGAVPFQYLGMINSPDTAPYVLLEHYGSRCVILAEQATNTRAQRFFTKLAVELLIAAARTRKSEPAKIARALIAQFAPPGSPPGGFVCCGNLPRVFPISNSGKIEPRCSV